MTALVHHFSEHAQQARDLARALGIEPRQIDHRTFPDGESLVRVEPGRATALLYCSLDDPNAKLIPLLLAAAALRDGGAGRIILVAPYLAYMRQDAAFAPGEAVSQRVIGKLIVEAFDGLVTVDPHLHRTPRLAAVVPGIAAVNVSAAPALVKALAAVVTPDTILVGPDAESQPWVAAIAGPLRLQTMVGEKIRRGDRQVEIVLPEMTGASGRTALLVDDLISSGGTLLECARQLTGNGLQVIGAAATHCLASEAELASLAAAGIVPILATDSVPGPAARIPLAATLADAIGAAGLL